MTAPTIPDDQLYEDQQRVVRDAVDTVQDAWQRLRPDDLIGSWETDVRPRAVIAIEEAQVQTAAPAAAYVAAALLAANAVSAPVGKLVAGAFAGCAANGLTLTRLLDHVIGYLRRALGMGMAPSHVREISLQRLLTYTATEITDTSRVAVHTAMLTEPAVAGYERVVRLPACGRCLILAGRLYPLSDGFARHPRCDCQMRPVTRDQWQTNDPGNTPTALFAAMTRAEQDKAFGVKDAEAIRAGADIAGVVNARRAGAVYVAGHRKYSTTRGAADGLGNTSGSGGQYRRRDIARPTAAQIFADGGDREHLLIRLRRYGYITS
ncbi:hypothetical protein [Alloactinosynnema sp. L-07]|uniref:VG15 protein n=1 Tax=Alloactinosynnema sp. L-07 TaxID=1653480 RepID=UPI00065F01F9|nr:hypothetical protein [Alloactinosynnema sp. L-07]CRK55437.1 hypothetical protein [Alloactinosynnema sp. L-07]